MYRCLFVISTKLCQRLRPYKLLKRACRFLKAEALTQSIINQGSDVAYHVRIGLSQFYGHHMLGKNIEELSTD